MYDFEHVQNATVCLDLNLTTCLFVHTFIPYFYSKWILLTRVKTLFYRTLLLWCTSNIFKHLYSYLDFIRFLWQSLHPWKKSFILISFMNQNNAQTSTYYTRIFQHKTIFEAHATDVIDLSWLFHSRIRLQNIQIPLHSYSFLLHTFFITSPFIILFYFFHIFE